MLWDTSKYNLIRERVCYLRFQNITWLDKEYVLGTFNLTWSEKEYVIRDLITNWLEKVLVFRDFKFNLITKKICY